MRLRSAFLSLLVLLLGPNLLPTSAGGQACPTGRISYIFVDNNSIFDLSEIDPDARFRWAYGLANKLHVRTRDQFILDEALFEVGECLDPLLLDETERLLRSYRFIGYADVFAIPQPDGSQHVNVYTRDEWTTKFDLGLRVDEGVRIEGVELTEENFLGRGILVRGFLRKDKEVQDLGFEVETPRFRGTRWDARVSVGSTRTGNFFETGLTYPFVGEVGRVGARHSFLWRESVFSYATGNDVEFSNLLLPFLDQRWDVAVGGRFGRPGDLFIVGFGISRESIDFEGYPGNLELVVDKDFGNTVPVDSAGIAEIEAQVQNRRANRVNAYLGKRNLHFVQKRGLDAMNGVQDVGVGTEFFLGLGQAWHALQEGNGPPVDDLHTQFSAFAGGEWDRWVINAQGSAEARYVRAPSGVDSEWKDIFAEADVLLYWQPRGDRFHTVLFRASATGGWSVTSPFQLTLGGRTALRGLREDENPGAHRVLFSLEDRITLTSPSPGLFDLGLAFFVDAGTIWADEVPFGFDSGWTGTLGAGLRIGLPPGTTNAVRLDLAMPLRKGAQWKDLILRVSLSELLGLLPGMRDRQLLRSLRNGVRPTLLTTPW